MSVMTESIVSSIDGAGHDSAVGQFAQVLANCESSNFAVAQAAYEDIQETRLSLAPKEFDALLAEATQFESEHDLRPQNYLVD